jgi:6-phosphogluconolactonase (cycloisomerase 2 family)
MRAPVSTCSTLSDPPGHLERRSGVDDIEPRIVPGRRQRAQHAVRSQRVTGSLARVIAYRIVRPRRIARTSRRDPTVTVRRRATSASHGDHVHVANYASGTIASYLVDDDGRFGQLVARHQHEGPGRTHDSPGRTPTVVPSPDGNVGVRNRPRRRSSSCATSTKHRSATGCVLAESTVMTPGAGPRHIAFHPDWQVAYVVCELDNTLVAFDVDDTGQMHQPRRGLHAACGLHRRRRPQRIAVHPDGHGVSTCRTADTTASRRSPSTDPTTHRC